MLARVYYSKVPVLRFALEDVLKQLMEDKFYKFEDFDLALISFSPEVYPIDENIVDTFNEYLGLNRWIAFHSITAFANEKTLNKSLVALFIKFLKNGSFQLFTATNLKSQYHRYLEETAQYINKTCTNHCLNLFLAAYSNGLVGFFIEDLNKYLSNRPINVLGGVASGLKNHGDVIANVYTSEGSIDSGFTILTLKNVKYAFGLGHGSRIIGPIYRITKAEGNRVYEVNGEPIKEILQKLTKGLPSDVNIFWYSPIVILDEKEGIVSILRDFKYIAPDLSYVEFWGPVKEGWHFRFSFALKEELLEDGTKEALKVHKSLKKVELGFNFSCMGRQFALEDLQGEEAKIYASIFNSPLFGFFTFGEIAPDRKRTSVKFYNQTSVIVGVQEI
ncbi:MAG TPA: hypothetical protein EYO62_02780 [Aquificales bacterium]|nr:hypothetical protein [Aquificales bacterium]